MSEPRALILTGLGLNCEAETEAAFAMAGARPDKVHLLDLLDGTAARKLADYPLLAFIGGFAFGDHLGAGSVFANKIRWRLYDDLLAFIEKGGLAIGICNGFQTMVRLGLLPGSTVNSGLPAPRWRRTTVSGYRDAWVTIGFDPASPCVWTRGLDVDGAPLAPRRREIRDDASDRGRRLEDEHLDRGPLPRRLRPPDDRLAGQSERLGRRSGRHLRSLRTVVRLDAAPRCLPVSVPPPAMEQAQALRDGGRRG